MSLTIGSLCSGYGGLDLAVEAVLDARTAWVSDIDKGACKVLAHRFPHAPNIGDMTAVDWAQVEPVDVVTAGYPCQPFSHAGARKGTEDARHLWPAVATAVGQLRPSLVIFENVRGHLSLGFDEVLRDLSLLNYRTAWTILKASDVGAPHGRARLFIVGVDRGRELRSRSDRRGRLHRPSRSGWPDAGPSQGEHDRQGFAGLASVGGSLRWDRSAGSQGERDVARDLDVAAQREACGRVAGSVSRPAAGQAGCGEDRAGFPVDAQLSGATPERSIALDGRDADQGTSAAGADPGSEPSRTRPDSEGKPPTFRCPTSGHLVGAGGRPVRPSRVHWSAPDDGTNGRRAVVRPDLALLPTPVADNSRGLPSDGTDYASLPNAVCSLLPTPAVNDMGAAYTPDEWDAWTERMKAEHGNGNGHGKSLSIEAQRLLPTPRAQDSDESLATFSARTSALQKQQGRNGGPTGMPLGVAVQEWGQYADAIARWESLTRPAPEPTETGPKGNPRLSPLFTEWMMGLPAGWITDVPDVTRNEALKLCGNGVVPQQAEAAIRFLLPIITRLEVAA